MPEQVVFFPGAREAAVAVVGGKGAALLRLFAEGFPVPPGAILTTAFFAPWFAEIAASDAWGELLQAPREAWGEAAAQVQALVEDLQFGAGQREVLERLVQGLRGPCFAVRSSSPEEDMVGASFAGGYVTRLGITAEFLGGAVRECFASSLDARVLHYKAERGLDPYTPRIAVVVQEQIASEVAGVGFSVNPLTNDYDEAVFDGAWGLGEPVVSGMVTPDHIVVERLSGAIREQTLGSKAQRARLEPSGGVVIEASPRASELCLDEAQIAELTKLVGRVEALYGAPVDIEWAFAEGRLYLLQSRPVTAWVPLPTELKTAPGERRRLYMDMGLSGGLTINAPISPIGQSWMAVFAGSLVKTFLGPLPVTLGPTDGLWLLTGGRMYQDLSNVLWMSSPKLLAKGSEQGDALMAATLANIDAEAYKAPSRPAWWRLRMLRLVPRALWRVRGFLWGALRSIIAPRRARARFDAEVARFTAEWDEVPASMGIPELVEAKSERVIRHVIETTMPALMVGLMGVSLANRVVPARHRQLADRLALGVQGNVVVEMGAALFELARQLQPADLRDPEELARRLAAGDLPQAFLAGWRRFLATWGWRGPHEVDLGSPRYADEPLLALRQLCAMGMGEGDFDPSAAQERQVQARRDAYDELLRQLGPVRRVMLRRAYGWIDLFAGTRDTPKHQYLMFFAALRRRALAEGRRFVEAGRLDAVDEVMGLRIDEIEAGRQDPTLDLRGLRRANTEFLDELRAVVKAFPAVIDSRGRILRPAPSPEVPGQATGMAISPGVVRGPAKVLHTPDEKPVLPGDILIAHTTDPGWTPLFVNAAAVVLEVGGVLQHGAVVAREYGKPCVGGIPGLLGRYEDGEWLEVDGSSGVVRRVSP